MPLVYVIPINLGEPGQSPNDSDVIGVGGGKSHHVYDFAIFALLWSLRSTLVMTRFSDSL